jgi:FkbM family methyltransferase
MKQAAHVTKVDVTGSGDEHVSLFQKLLDTSPRGLYVDLGVNQGTLVKAAVARGHPAVGFEAIAQNYVFFLESTRNLQCRESVRVFHIAASERSGDLLQFSENQLGENMRNGQQLAVTDSNDLFSLQHVFTMRLDEVIDSQITLLKLDIEGGETSALKGARCLLQQGLVDFIHSEFSPSNMESVNGKGAPHEMLELLFSSKYRVFVDDCSHNILPEVTTLLPVKCGRQAERSAAEYETKVATRDYAGLQDYEVTQVNAVRLVQILLENVTPLKCCLVNLGAFRSTK